MLSRNTLAGLLAASILASATQPVWAGGWLRPSRRTVANCPNGQCSTTPAATYYYYPTPQAQPAQPAAQPQPEIMQASYTTTAQSTAPVTSGDPYGFGVWLNSVRAQYGLHALAYDANLAGHAAVNSSYGFGHTYMGGTSRQNVGWGALSTVSTMWMASPAHRAAILDSRVTSYGLAYINGVWTFNAR